MELSNQPPGSHPLTALVHPLERVTGPPELQHSKGRCRSAFIQILHQLHALMNKHQHEVCLATLERCPECRRLKKLMAAAREALSDNGILPFSSSLAIGLSNFKVLSLSTEKPFLSW